MKPPTAPEFESNFNRYQRVNAEQPYEVFDVEAVPVEGKCAKCTNFFSILLSNCCNFLYHPYDSIEKFFINHRSCFVEWFKIILTIIPFLTFIYGYFTYSTGVSHNGFYENHGLFDEATCKVAQKYCDMRTDGIMIEFISFPFMFCSLCNFCYFLRDN